MSLNPERKHIGYQIKSASTKNNLPDGFDRRWVFPEKWARNWIDGHDVIRWKLVPVYEGDVKDYKFVERL